MPSRPYDVKLELGSKQTMRDGTKLAADVFRPDASGRFPVIITRTPYRTVEGFQQRQNDEALFFARHGYVYIIQDCRGKNDSEGVFRPFQDDDARDGYDTLLWASNQEWSNGSLGTIGASYAAWNQWCAATLEPPGLKAMVCTVSLPDPVRNVPYQNGALVLWMAEWAALIEGKRNTNTSLYDTKKIFWHLPLKSTDSRFGRKNSRTWQEWIAHPSADGYWKRAFYQDKLNRVNVPVFHISGWYDDDIIGTHTNFLGMTDASRSSKTRKNQRLIIGPWQHHVNMTRKLGEIDFGETALVDLRGAELRWFDHWLKGIDNGTGKERPVEIFTTGRNAWGKYDRWPFANANPTRYYLHSGGGANTCYGDGLLSIGAPDGKEASDRYSYDPHDPVPNIDDQGSGAEGPFDQRPIERRDDVLVYSTPPLERATEVSGRVTVELFASTSARDTDFWAQLTDVFPSGYSMHLTEGIVRGRYAKSLESPRLLKPGAVNEFTIDLWIVSNAFLRGHQVRLDLSSSSFPKYDRNPNTGHRFGQDSKLMVAQQTVFHSDRYPSSVVLPVVGRRNVHPSSRSNG
jgi:putative CocE/NonD family hydrolase